MIKRLSPVKIQNPVTDGHSVRLQPCQGFDLYLSGGSSTVELKSDFLEQTGQVQSGEDIVISFEQTKDLSSWVGISGVFLGNLIVNYNTPESSRAIRLCITMDIEPNRVASVITVINPDTHLIKIDPRQSIEFVFKDKNADLSINYDKDKIEQLRYETVDRYMRGIYNKEAPFCCEARCVDLPPNPTFSNPEILSQNDADIDLTDENHFWFRLKKDYFKKDIAPNLDKMNSETIGNIVFSNAKTGMVSNSLQIMLNTRGLRNKDINFAKFDALSRKANDLFERYVKDAILVNPNQSENVDIPISRRYFYIEIPQPNIYYKSFSEEETWTFSISSSISEYEEHKFLDAVELRSRLVGGKLVQRFLITNFLTAYNEIKNSNFLGAIKFEASQGGDYGSRTIKELTVNFWKSDGSKTNVVSPPQQSRGFSSYSSSDYQKYHYERPRNQYPKQNNDFIYEIEIEQLDDFKSGAKFLKLSDIHLPKADNQTAMLALGYADWGDWERYRKKKASVNVRNHKFHSIR